MTAARSSRVQKATALIPLAVLSAAATATAAGIGGTGAALASSDQARLPDGSLLPADAIEAPASLSAPGGVAPAVSGDGNAVVTSASTSGIPSLALAAYQRSEAVINAADKACQLPWQLTAAIGRVESDHGRFRGNSLDDDGVATPGIYGIALNGKNNTRAITDTDAGQYDNDTVWDRAVGPMQFIPSTWAVVGVDGDNDGKRNPQDIDDSALAAAVYLCSGKDDLGTDAGRRAAVHRYNNSDAYVDLVLRIMDAYMSGDYSSVPNSTTSAGQLVTDPTYPTPEQGDNNDDQPWSNVENAPQGQDQDDQPDDNSTTAPPQDNGNQSGDDDNGGKDKGDGDKDKEKDSGGPLDPITNPIGEVVDEPVTAVLTLTQALNICGTEIDKIPDPLGLLKGAKQLCANRLVGQPVDQALSLIPNTLTALLKWLGLVK